MATIRIKGSRKKWESNQIRLVNALKTTPEEMCLEVQNLVEAVWKPGPQLYQQFWKTKTIETIEWSNLSIIMIIKK